MMKTSALFVLVVLSLTLAACRWQPAPSPTVYLGDPTTAEEAAFATLHSRGYYVLSHNEDSGRITVVSKGEGATRVSDSWNVDEVDPERYSRITVQVFDDGSVDVTGSGHHYRSHGKKMHVQLSREIEQLQRAILERGLAMRARRQRSASIR